MEMMNPEKAKCLFCKCSDAPVNRTQPVAGMRVGSCGELRRLFWRSSLRSATEEQKEAAKCGCEPAGPNTVSKLRSHTVCVERQAAAGAKRAKELRLMPEPVKFDRAREAFDNNVFALGADPQDTMSMRTSWWRSIQRDEDLPPCLASVLKTRQSPGGDRWRCGGAEAPLALW